MSLDFKWEWSEANAWLPIEDAVLSNFLSKKGGEILEVGTWRGGWTLTLAENDRGKNFSCVDPYPNLEDIKYEFLKEVDLRAPGKVKLFNTLDSCLTATDFFDLIHVDGEHSQDAVLRDLRQVIPTLKTDGILIVDDIFYHSFPGVTAALFQVLQEFELSPFLFSQKKLYICNKTFYQEYYYKTRTLLELLNLNFEEDELITKKKVSYAQSNSINGFSLLILDPHQKNRKKFLDSINVKANRSPKAVLRKILPPILIEFYSNHR